MENIIDNNSPFEATMRMDSMMGNKVLSSKGCIVGKVAQIRICPKSLELEGILVKRGKFKEPIFFGKTYFKKLSTESVILSIEPSVLILGRKVITHEGQVLGKVRDIKRKVQTNDIQSITVKPLLRKSLTVLEDSIKSAGTSVILKESYHVPKKH